MFIVLNGVALSLSPKDFKLHTLKILEVFIVLFITSLNISYVDPRSANKNKTEDTPPKHHSIPPDKSFIRIIESVHDVSTKDRC